jgi:hypothetical protein
MATIATSQIGPVGSRAGSLPALIPAHCMKPVAVISATAASTRYMAPTTVTPKGLFLLRDRRGLLRMPAHPGMRF